MDFILSLVGVLLIVEGLPYFAFPDKLKSYLSRILATPDSTLRHFGLIAMIAGLVLVYLGRNLE